MAETEAQKSEALKAEMLQELQLRQARLRRIEERLMEQDVELDGVGRRCGILGNGATVRHHAMYRRELITQRLRTVKELSDAKRDIQKVEERIRDFGFRD